MKKNIENTLRERLKQDKKFRERQKMLENELFKSWKRFKEKENI